MMDKLARWRSGNRIAILGLVIAFSVAGCGDKNDFIDVSQYGPSAKGGTTTGTDGTTVASDGTGRNRLPEISGDPIKVVDPGEFYYFLPTAQDADGDALSFTVYNLPSWLSFDSTTGTLSGTPTTEDAGHYPNVIIRVSDGQASSQLWPFSIDVLPGGSASAFLTWIPPTENEDGSPVLELAGYRVRYGVQSGNYADLVEIPDPKTTVLDLSFLPSNTYYFVITAFNLLGAESEYSNEERIAVN